MNLKISFTNKPKVNCQKENWINIGKLIAIIAVLTDHLYGTLYSSEGLQRLSFYSVSLFILLMGVTTYWSFSKAICPIGKKVVQRIIGIIVPYAVAVFIYEIVKHKSFSFAEYINSLIHFNASGPHYYVLLYIQLLIVAPIVFYIINRLTGKYGKLSPVIKLLFAGGGSFRIENNK